MRSILDCFPSTHSFLLLVKYGMQMFKNVINTIYLFRLSQFSPPKTNENFELLPSSFLPGVDV